MQIGPERSTTLTHHQRSTHTFSSPHQCTSDFNIFINCYRISHIITGRQRALRSECVFYCCFLSFSSHMDMTIKLPYQRYSVSWHSCASFNTHSDFEWMRETQVVCALPTHLCSTSVLSKHSDYLLEVGPCHHNFEPGA